MSSVVTFPAPGYYAVLFSWEADEGIFNGGRYWDGEVFRDTEGYAENPAIFQLDDRHPEAFDTLEAAIAWAADHDVEDPRNRLEPYTKRLQAEANRLRQELGRLQQIEQTLREENAGLRRQLAEQQGPVTVVTGG